MEQDIKVANKIIVLDTVKKVAEYIQSISQKYNELIINDKEKNEKIEYKNRKYEYFGNPPKLDYTVETLDGKVMTQNDYEWFKEQLLDSKNLKRVEIQLGVYFSETLSDTFDMLSKHLSIDCEFREERVRIYVDGKELESEVQRAYSDIREMIESSNERYDKTIKKRNSRIQSFCFCVGMVLAYIAIIILLFNLHVFPEKMIPFINNKYVLVVIHIALSIALGNIFGSFYMKKLYEGIVPEKKYSHYSDMSRESVYVDNVADYTEKNEIQIGKFYNSLERRNKIEGIYGTAKMIVLAQLLIYGIYLVFTK